MPKRKYSRKSSKGRKRKYKYRSKTGRAYRKVKRGGKTYRRYKKSSQRIVSNLKNRNPASRGLDREHFKITSRFTGTLVWVNGALASWTYPLTRIVDLSDNKDHTLPAGTWTKPANGSDYNFTDVGTINIPGTLDISNKYANLYISSVDINWQVARSDAQDDSITRMHIVPINYYKYLGLDKTFSPNNFWPGGDLYDSYDNMLQEPEVKSATLSAARANRQFGSLTVHVPFKKFTSPGFPLSSAQWWTDTVYGSNSSLWSPPDNAYNPYAVFTLYNDGLGSDVRFEMKFSFTYYITAFNPRIQGLVSLAGPQGATGLYGDQYPLGGLTGPSGAPGFGPFPQGMSGAFET